MGRRTPLYDWHASAGAKIIDFGGWDMPVIYSSIVEEHKATRECAGVFDVSHMGRFWFDGPDVDAFLDRVATNQVATLAEGQIRYSLILNEAGGTRDDVLIYRYGDRRLMVVNAGNRLKLLEWFKSQMPPYQVTIEDTTTTTVMFAVQGPRAIEFLQPFVDVRLAEINNYFGTPAKLLGAPAFVSRTGYTGEDGVEVIAEPEVALQAWTRIIDTGRERGVRAAGLGARDTLRLEASMPLYGHELTEEIDPLQSGLGWAVKNEEKDFIGRDALLHRPSEREVRVGLVLEGRRIAREGHVIFSAGEEVGTVTSGTFAPTLQKSIAMAYVDPSCKPVGTQLEVDIRGSKVPALVVAQPFYKRSRR